MIARITAYFICPSLATGVNEGLSENKAAYADWRWDTTTVLSTDQRIAYHSIQ